MFRSPKILGLIALLVGLSAIDARAGGGEVAASPSLGGGGDRAFGKALNPINLSGTGIGSRLLPLDQFNLYNDPAFLTNGLVDELASQASLNPRAFLNSLNNPSGSLSLDPNNLEATRLVVGAAAAVAAATLTKKGDVPGIISGIISGTVSKLQADPQGGQDDAAIQLSKMAASMQAAARNDPASIAGGLHKLANTLHIDVPGLNQVVDTLNINATALNRAYDNRNTTSSQVRADNNLTTSGFVIAAAFQAGSQNMQVQPTAAIARLRPAIQSPQHAPPLVETFQNGVAASVRSAPRTLSQRIDLNQVVNDRYARANSLADAVAELQPGPQGGIRRIYLVAEGGLLGIRNGLYALYVTLTQGRLFIGEVSNFAPQLLRNSPTAPEIAPAPFNLVRPKDPLVSLRETGLQQSFLRRRVPGARRLDSNIPRAIREALRAAAGASFTLRVSALVSTVVDRVARVTTSVANHLDEVSAALQSALTPPQLAPQRTRTTRPYYGP